MVRGRHVYGLCIIHELTKKYQKGSENDSSDKVFAKPCPFNTINSVSKDYNVIATTCRVYNKLLRFSS